MAKAATLPNTEVVASATPTLRPQRQVAPPSEPWPADWPERIVEEGKVWKGIRIAGYVGYVPDTTAFPAGKPFMQWEGGRISAALWASICSFFEWSQQEFKSEAQVRLFYNPATRKWAAWAFPQTPNGMTTQELPDHPDTAAQRAQFPEPWRVQGTVHHHCTATAFQSGTDKHNETDQEGIHITVGGISAKEYSLHMRVQVRSTEFKVDLASWFELPEAIEVLSDKVRNLVLDALLKEPPTKDTVFPEQWKTNCQRPKFAAGYGGTGAYSNTPPAGRSGSASSSSITDNGNFVVRIDIRGEFTAPEVDFMRAAVAMMAAGKITHNKADFILTGEDDTGLSLEDREFVTAVTELSKKLGLGWARVDELFDKWDFETVINEIDRLIKVDEARKSPGLTVLP